MRRAQAVRRRPRGDTRRLGSACSQDGGHDVRRPPRPLRHHPGGVQQLRQRRALRGRQPPRPRVRGQDNGHGARARGQEPQHPHRRHRADRRETRSAQPLRNPPLHNRGGDRRRRRPANEVPLPRPAPPQRAPQPRAAPPHDHGGAPLSRLQGVPRDRDPDARRLHPRGRATSWCPRA